MALSSAVIDAMVAAGCTVEQLAAAMKADNAEREARQADKRAKDAERQRKSRANRSMSHDVTVTPCDSADVETAKEKSPHTPLKENNTPVSLRDTAPTGAKRSRGSRIDPDWKPPVVAALPPEPRTLAKQWTDAAYRTEGAAFVDYWLGESGAKASKADWNRAWFNRISQIHSKVMRDQKFGNGPVASNDGGGGMAASILAKQRR